ncbi:MAG TPA: Gfo/Idh/MocA family oxidoreductase [Coriobacteriia bacterium]|nr:Gfo/Idh/MocA family oxidoreductase [Coriobacteriia bacterium]
MSVVPDRALVVGSGSIAQRHVRNLLALGVGTVEVVTKRDVGDVEAFADTRVSVVPELPADAAPFAVIANNSDLHVGTAAQLVEAGTHLLVEKPIAVELDSDVVSLCLAVRARGVVARVAYNLRLLGVMREIEGAMRDGALGTPLFARIEVGQWLPDWRPNRPHEASYSASGRGGGVGLDLSHEIDYMRMLFGQPSEWCGRSSSTGVLGIEAPDVFDAIYRFESGFSCTVHLDYLERQVRRRLRIVGSDGVIECDIAGKRMSVRTAEGERIYDDPALFDVQRTYPDELMSVFTEIADRSTPSLLPSLDDACEVLALLAEG